MPTRKTQTQTQAQQFRAINNFEYPASLSIRNRIRGGEDIPFEERGEMIEVMEGAELAATDIPDDLKESWLKRNIVPIDIVEENNDTKK